ncbi:MAG TPA: hypothetical protein VD860_18825 [Azospirillum sp.]|nr:hypothetical protein [Azospirillum sp.]
MDLTNPQTRAEVMGRLDALAAQEEQAGGLPMDDPAVRAEVLAKLDDATSLGGTALDAARSGATGFNAGLANAVDTYAVKPYRVLEQLARMGVNGLAHAVGSGDWVSPEPQTGLARDLADRAGLTDYTPQTKTGQYARSVGEGVGESLPFAVGGAVNPAVLGTVGANLMTGAGSGAGQQVARDTGMNPTLGAIAGGLSGQGLATAGAKAMNATTGAGKSPMLADYDAAGVTPRLPGNATDSAGWGRVQSALGGVYGDVRAARGEVDDLGQAAQRVAERVGPGQTVDDAGAALAQARYDYQQGFRDQTGRLYDELDKHLPATTPVGITNTMGTLTDVSRQFPDAAGLSQIFDPSLYRQITAALSSDAAGGTLSLQSLKSLRTQVGDMLASHGADNGASKAALSRLYGAITDDITNAAHAAGPQAEDAMRTASDFFKSGMQFQERHGPLWKENATGVDLYQYVTGQAGKGADRLADLKNHLPADQWDQFVSSEVYRLGLAKPGQAGATGEAFSPNTFLTNYNKLRQSGAAEVLFPAQVTEDLDRLARIAGVMQDSQKLWNHSNTAGNSFVLDLLKTAAAGGGGGAALGMPGTGALGAASAFLTGKAGAVLFTQPAFVRWLATSAGDTSMSARNGLLRVVDFANAAGMASDPEVKADIAAKVQAAGNWLSNPTDDYLSRLNRYAQVNRMGPVQPARLNDHAGVITGIAQANPGFAGELERAAAQSPAAYRAALFRGLQDPARKPLVEQALQMGRKSN